MALFSTRQLYGQVSMTLASGDFTFYFERYVAGQWLQMSATDQLQFFNRAHCECDNADTAMVKIAIVPAVGTPQKIQSLLTPNFPNGIGRLYVGAEGFNCLNPSNYTGNIELICTNLLDPTNYGASFPLSVFETQRFYESPPFPVAWLFNSQKMSCGTSGTCDSIASCITAMVTQPIYFWAQTHSGSLPDFIDPAFEVDLGGAIPTAPASVTAEADSDSIVVHWEWPVTWVPDGIGVQIFCTRPAGIQVFPTGSFAPAYATTAMVCPGSPSASLDPFSSLVDPAFLCSGLLPATATSHRVSGLQAETAYSVAVAAVDRLGNIGRPSYVPGPITTTRRTTRFAESGCSMIAGHGRGSGGVAGWVLVGGLVWVLWASRLGRRHEPAWRCPAPVPGKSDAKHAERPKKMSGARTSR
jgi:hypothetical protein